jgi:hypothetical protein
MVACQPAPVVHPGFEPLAAPLPASAVPLRFIPRATSTMLAMPHVAPESPVASRVVAAPPAATDGPPPREWSSSPIVYTKRHRHPTPSAPVGPASTMPDRCPPTAVPVTPPVNPHRMVTQVKVGFRVLPDHLILAASMSPSTLSLVRAALADPNWCAAMEDEYGAPMSNGTWKLLSRPRGSNIVNGKWVFTHKLHADGSFDRYKVR